MMTRLTFRRLSGEALHPFIPELARLRMQVFRDFPYLYEGDPDYETRYLQTYTEAPHSVIVLALEGDRVVGASTGLPLCHETADVQRPFHEAGYSIDDIFYCGESVLLAEYRGQGAGVAFFQQREAHAREIGGMTRSCFCAVERPATHPTRPATYQPLDQFWHHRGYEKHPELATHFSWRDLGEAQETLKPMTFWMKSLP
ncbi:GNAT family N-acetyltransferase [Larsenimonas rhizosphaerae]|uniref:GNAT family N-acetyltransferase n=1 Tax=Larsenimonas rhizosphaerae TaxID=2944682 RepID=A0AA41ZNE3_9GAMM|nr:GNAT family N-acetyltransferase [Larsenimonas rhizosphaerae]MCX2525506.1 GNAT family N-acetyltransferase [Larsenimonas rhizosphaerae]